MNFSIIIPLYNEELNIKKLLEEIDTSIDILEHNYEIVLINDGSTDNTLNIIIDIKNNEKTNLIVVNNKNNIGQSLSLVEGIKSAKYNIIVTIDGDGQNNPADITRLIKVYKENEDCKLVGGLRLKRSDSFIKRYSSKIANFVRMSILKDDCKDTGCSLKVFSKSVFLKFPVFNGMHRFLPALFKAFNAQSIFIEVDHRKRKYGKSKYGTIDRLFRGIYDIYLVKKIIKKNTKN